MCRLQVSLHRVSVSEQLATHGAGHLTIHAVDRSHMTEEVVLVVEALGAYVTGVVVDAAVLFEVPLQVAATGEPLVALQARE